MGTAASLFRNIKDIRDELNILKAVAESQDSVQSSLQYYREQDVQSARSVIRDIREMDEIAKRIQNSVNTTLTLEQNDIAISQAQEGVKQGRTLMVFTVVTILFVRIHLLFHPSSGRPRSGRKRGAEPGRNGVRAPLSLEQGEAGENQGDCLHGNLIPGSRKVA